MRATACGLSLAHGAPSTLPHRAPSSTPETRDSYEAGPCCRDTLLLLLVGVADEASLLVLLFGFWVVLWGAWICVGADVCWDVGLLRFVGTVVMTWDCVTLLLVLLLLLLCKVGGEAAEPTAGLLLLVLMSEGVVLLTEVGGALGGVTCGCTRSIDSSFTAVGKVMESFSDTSAKKLRLVFGVLLLLSDPARHGFGGPRPAV